jgi:DNA-directed RNA polymerase subunit omega
MNSELTKKALEVIVNPNLLVNLVSRRVRQLNSGGGGMCRPLVEIPVGAGVADIALLEIIEGKISFDMVDEDGVVLVVPEAPKPVRRRKKAAAAPAAPAA